MANRKRGLPKVSIVIPVYNGANFMREAIDSALRQTYKNIEVIVVNDGSNDDGETDMIAKSYGRKIRYYQKQNGGVSTALNLAIGKMTGEYFSWLSHDDTYEPEKIERQIDYLVKNDMIGEKVILYSDYKLMGKKGKFLANCVKDHNELVNKPEYALLKGNVNGITLLIPKAAFSDHGLFDTNLRCTQDYDLWRRMFRTYRPVHMTGLVTNTRIHARQDTNANPLVVSEGNKLYMELINDLSVRDIRRLERSEYIFYKEMADFLKSTPYNEAQKYCQQQVDSIYEARSNEFSEADYLVSVIIPTYNRVNETIRAIKSALAQTYKNIEVIVVDDGSTVSIKPIKELAKKNKKIRLIELGKNLGASTARNTGIKEAKGEYVAFLDSDDEFIKGKIEKQAKLMYVTNCIMSHASYQRNMDNSKVVVHSGRDVGNISKRLIASCQIALPTVMLNRAAILKGKLFFDTNLEIGEDVCYWLSILKGNYLEGIDEPLTIVHTGTANAAYNTDKQIVGQKSVLKYVLNDEYYSIYDTEICRLCDHFSYYVKAKYGLDVNQESAGMVEKVIDTMKAGGVRLLLKKSVKKIGRVIRRLGG